MAVDNRVVRVLNEAYLKMTDVRTKDGPALDVQGAHAFVVLGLEDLCALPMDSVYETIAALDDGARQLVAAQAVVELARLEWRVPVLRCPECDSDSVDSSSDGGWRCDDCDHEWTGEGES